MKNLSILLLIALIVWWVYENISRFYWITFGKLAMGRTDEPYFTYKGKCYVK